MRTIRQKIIPSRKVKFINDTKDVVVFFDEELYKKIIYDKFYYYDFNDINSKLIEIETTRLDTYNDFSDIFNIIYQTNSLEEAKENLILLIKTDKYNL